MAEPSSRRSGGGHLHRMPVTAGALYAGIEPILVAGAFWTKYRLRRYETRERGTSILLVGSACVSEQGRKTSCEAVVVEARSTSHAASYLQVPARALGTRIAPSARHSRGPNSAIWRFRPAVRVPACIPQFPPKVRGNPEAHMRKQQATAHAAVKKRITERSSQH